MNIWLLSMSRQQKWNGLTSEIEEHFLTGTVLGKGKKTVLFLLGLRLAYCIKSDRGDREI